jgi:hypothetical protein
MDFYFLLAKEYYFVSILPGENVMLIMRRMCIPSDAPPLKHSNFSKITFTTNQIFIHEDIYNIPPTVILHATPAGQ